MNGTSCWGVVLRDGSTTHVHADRVWVEGGSLFFAEERENPDFGRLQEPETCFYVIMAFAAGEWLRTFAASIVDGAPLAVVQYGECETSARKQGPVMTSATESARRHDANSTQAGEPAI